MRLLDRHGSHLGNGRTDENLPIANDGPPSVSAEDPRSDAIAEFDHQVRQAKIIVVNANIASTSLIQRKLKIGFARAGAVMDALEQIGVVGPVQGSMPREVLMTPEDLKGGQS